MFSLRQAMHKGQAGRIGIIGGSEQYTGAPYFAAISALRTGADLAWVICDPSAATPIKSYSPDIIVCPWLNNNREESWHSVLDKLHAVVIGPGLSRSPMLQQDAAAWIRKARKRNIPIIIDADGLFLVQQNLSLVQGYSRCVLTPNAVEFNRLYEQAKLADTETDMEQRVHALASRLKGPIIVRKGEKDIISNGHDILTSSSLGSMRRVGGQGDILSGVLGTLVAWHYLQKLETTDSPLQSCLLGCNVVRECAATTFEQHGRAMITSDMLLNLGSVVQDALHANL